jgi:hypothetical protein
MTNETIIEDLRLVSVPQWWENPWVWVAAGIVVVAAIVVLRRWMKSRLPPLKLPNLAPTGPPAHLEALRRLEELRAKHAKVDAYVVATECADILRRYIEARYSLPIRYQTTREFLGVAVADAGLAPEARKELGEFLEFFDGIKFAQASAAPERTAAAIDGGERFVRRSIPAEAGVAP